MREPCCEANELGFRCFCNIGNPRYSQEAEDAGIGDYMNDIERDMESENE